MMMQSKSRVAELEPGASAHPYAHKEEVVSLLLRVVVLVLLAAVPLRAQGLNSGSNGSDGALTFPVNSGEVVFDPIALGLTPRPDNIFHFTTITIGAGTTVRMPFNTLQGLPVVWLASGAVQINGIINLDGGNGAAAITGTLNRASVPGPGGYPGGVGGGGPGFVGTNLLAGLGPGGGLAAGSSAGHAHPGPFGGAAYGNALLVPLRGGSGGGGGSSSADAGGGGGAGGGALRIFSSTSIILSGSITVNGGDGGAPPPGQSQGGGGGSGGSIHLIAPAISGSGTLSAEGGAHGNTPGANRSSRGRVRLDATSDQFTGAIVSFVTRGTPYNVPLPTAGPTVRVTSIAGIPVSATPTGDAVTPDASINQSGPVTVAIEARNIPLGTVLEVRVMSEALPDFVVNSTALVGTTALSTATAAVTFPPGFSRGYVRATWNPPSP